jgi:hypothetical protein
LGVDMCVGRRKKMRVMEMGKKRKKKREMLM